LLRGYEVSVSMSRKGNCYDNAPIESFFGTLKTELVHHRRYQTRAEAEREISEYIDLFYNRQRRQARLGYLSPAAYTQLFTRQQRAAWTPHMASIIDDLPQCADVHVRAPPLDVESIGLKLLG
jgi:putative transposase